MEKTALNRLADILGNLCCRQALPTRIAQWSLASLQHEPVNAEQRQLHHARDDEFPNNGRRSIYRALWLGVMWGILFSFLGPVKLNAQSQPASVSPDANESPEYQNQDVTEGSQETLKPESPDATEKPQAKSSGSQASGGSAPPLLPAESKPAPGETKKKEPRSALEPLRRALAALENDHDHPLLPPSDAAGDVSLSEIDDDLSDRDRLGLDERAENGC